MGLTERLARASCARPWRTIGAWVTAVVLAVGAVASFLGDGLTSQGETTGSPESTRAADLEARAFPPDPRHFVSDVVVVRSERHAVDSTPFRAFVARLAREGRATGAVTGVPRTWYATHDPSLVSADRHATLIPIGITSSDDAGAVVDVVRRADASPGFAVSMTGDRTSDHDFNTLSEDDLRTGEFQFGLPAALVILVLVFGSVVAGLVPVFLALISIVVALGLVALVTTAFELSVFVVNMLTGMGLALGIDYALFVVSRYREERGRGLDERESIAAAGATASRAVLFSGTAFVVAMFGMLLVPSTIMRSLAAGAILVGIVSVAAALTLLPALLGLLGDRVNRLRIPFVGSAAVERANPEGRFWRAIVDRVLRRPALSLALAAAVMLAAAAPVFGLAVGASGVSTLPDRFVSKRGFEALARDFPGESTDPVEIVVEGAGSARARAALAGLRDRLASDPRFGPGSVRRSGCVAVLSVPVRGDAAGPKATAAVRDLRSNVVPAAFGATGAKAYVGGSTSENVDYFDAVTNPAPYVFAFVLGLTFVLLTVVFRSVAVAGTAILLNLLSVGAAYGLLVLVFQHGWGAGLLGFEQAPTIEAWVPLFLFSVLFGLSMDYQVFLLSRVKERYDASGDSAEAVAHGVASTARIITGAALIIVAVFAGFARGELIMFQQMGFGVAVALLLDATVIRSVILPSAMRLLGRRNWYLPAWLEWLPHLDIEREPSAPAPRPEPV